MSTDEDRGFKVEDRRVGADTSAQSDRDQRDSSPEPGSEEAGGLSERQLPELDFSTFILSLSTSAMVHLGEAPHPDGAVRKDLILAKQTIDLLGVLKEKTKGNLTPEEARLFDDVLYDLRLRYVGAAR